MTGKRLSTDVRLDIVDRWHRAYGDRDVVTMCSLAHPEIEVEPVRPLLTRLPGASFRGHVGLRTLALWSYENYPRLRLESSHGRTVRGRVLSSATYILDDLPTPVVKRHTDSLFDVDNGLIRRVQSFIRDSDALEAAQRAAMLTDRQREVFELLAAGMSAPEIAQQLSVSPATVRTHVQNAVARLGAKTRVQAISIALQRGEIHP